ncbi:MAG: type II toxin-antitoxin system RelB/DinJ family antitoxin [Erysipelotrichaceae bacterium]|nr:type II toxin-antitoxin system RelB/DinJ family antitoxin [Erysipelotrichaceae bacterium]
MSKTAIINIRIDPQSKEDAEALFARYGMTISQAVSIFIHQSLNVGGLPFDVRPIEPLNQYTKPAGMKGVLREYGDPALMKLEKDAWKETVIKKYGNL